jgi:hypothetical protein
MSPGLYQQEFECSFTAAIEGTYYHAELDQARREGRIGRVPVERGLPVETFWDLGVGDATAIIFVQVIGREIRLIDYLEDSGEGLGFYAGALAARGYACKAHHLPHDADSREIGTGRTRADMLRGLGVAPLIVDPRPHDVLDGIEAVRMVLGRCWIDTERCVGLLNALGAYRKRWNQQRQTYERHPYHDFASHGADAMRLLAMRQPLRPSSRPPGPRAIRGRAIALSSRPRQGLDCDAAALAEAGAEVAVQAPGVYASQVRSAPDATWRKGSPARLHSRAFSGKSMGRSPSAERAAQGLHGWSPGSGARTHRRRPSAFDLVGVALSRPGGHGHPDRCERLGAERPELEMRPHRDRETHAGVDRHHLIFPVRLPPHLAATLQEKPDLFDSAMSNGDRRLSGPKLEVGESAAAESQQQPNFGTVRCDGIGRNRKALSRESAHGIPRGARIGAERRWRSPSAIEAPSTWSRAAGNS